MHVTKELLTLAMSHTCLDGHVLGVKVSTKVEGFLRTRLSIVVASCVNEWLERFKTRRQLVVPSLRRVDERQSRNGSDGLHGNHVPNGTLVNQAE